MARKSSFIEKEDDTVESSQADNSVQCPDEGAVGPRDSEDHGHTNTALDKQPCHRVDQLGDVGVLTSAALVRVQQVHWGEKRRFCVVTGR